VYAVSLQLRNNISIKNAIVPFCLAAILGASEARAADKVEYNRDIRPILMENCFACHGPDSAARKAKLRLDHRDAAIQAEAFVPGKPAESELVRRITANNLKERMPPPQAHKTLTAAQKDLLQQWIAQGAEYQPHWSYLPPQRPALPAVRNTGWVRNPIDRFILAKLDAAKLTPASEADRRTLARRLSLDLTGLPPATADVEAFVNDTAADAYEKYVDKMLASVLWGEHRARYWLDAARYADTHGLHFDNYREMWPYRDWVINAFNSNMRFDQFTIEQLAGDLLPNPTMDQLIASGFNRCNVTTNEGGTIPEENLVFYTRDRTETVAQIWLGLTANCAVCHDHKFDDFTMRDFYSMSAFFNNSTVGALDGNVHNTPPIIVVPRQEERGRWTQLSKELSALRSQIEDRKKALRPAFDQWLTEAKPRPSIELVPTSGLALHVPLDEGNGKTFHAAVNGNVRSVDLESGFDWVQGNIGPKAMAMKAGQSIELPDVGDFDTGQGFSVGVWLKFAKRGQTGALASRMNDGPKFGGWDLWIENDRVGMHIINQWPDNALKVLSKTLLQPNQWHYVMVTYDGTSKAGGLAVYVNGVAQDVEVFADKLTGSIRTAAPFKIGQRKSSSRLPAGMALQDVRVYSRSLNGMEVEHVAKGTRAGAIFAKAADKRTAQETTELYNWWLVVLDEQYRDLRTQSSGLIREEAQIRGRGAVTHVMKEREQPAEAYVLFRGDYDKRRDKVSANSPHALLPMNEELPHNRLGFAKWLLKPEHPLTARVTVNRFWQEVFGTGLVRTAGDFGVSGEQPSHPELLDWLAVEFRESGWDVKRFFKLMVTSATYRQAAVATKEKLVRDPNNILLSRGPRYRLDAEMIRDYALAASGLLIRKIGGPSVKPYQPTNVWEVTGMPESNTRKYQQDHGEALYRRSLYTFWKRGAPPASMEILNAPSREFCTVRRERTNTPMQALVTLNDPQFVEAARHLAELTLKEGGANFESRVDFMAKRLLARPLDVAEASVVRKMHEEFVGHYQSHAADARQLIIVGETIPDPALDAATLAAWTMVANQLFNLDEVLCK
jgi:mono/diheme cytochrome c family protein